MRLTRLIDDTRYALLAAAMLCFPTLVGAQDLGHLLHQIEKVSPQLAASQAQASAAKSGVDIANSQYWGRVDVFGQTTRYNSERLVNPISYPPVLTRSLYDRSTYGYGASLTLPIDINGQITSQVHAKEHLRQAASQGIKQTRLALFSQAVNLYRNIQKLEGIKKALNEQLIALKGHHKVTLTAVNIGRVASVELLRIQAEIKAVEGQLAGLNGDEARLRANLGSLLNQGTYKSSIAALKTVPDEINPQEQSKYELTHRPDLQVANSINDSQDENLKHAKQAWLPTLSLRAETIRNQGYTANGANTWSIGAQLTWQAWDGGSRSAHIDQMYANREIAQEKYQSTLNQAKAELSAAQSNWQASSLQYQATSAGLKASEENERIQSDRFSNGRISAVDLIDAEAALARARADQMSALANWWLSDDQLHLARGESPSAYEAVTEQQENQHVEH